MSRRGLLAAGGVLVATGALAADGPITPASSRFRDDLTGVPDGPLAGRLAVSGHRWTATGAGADPPPQVHAGTIGPPPGTLPGRRDGRSPAAGYATVGLGAPVVAVGAEFRWDRSSAPRSSLALGAFTWPATGIPGGPEARTGASPMHLALTPWGLQYAVFARGVDPEPYTPLAPVGRTDRAVHFPTPMRCDGVTTHRVDIERNGDTAVVTVDDLGSWVFRASRIAAVPARFPFFEYFSVPGGDNVPRFVRVWADST